MSHSDFANPGGLPRNLLLTVGCRSPKKLPKSRGGILMRRVVASAAAVLIAGLAWCGIRPAWAATDGPADAVAHVLFFGGADIWRNGGFTHGGFLYAYQGLDQDGLVFKLLLNGGLYRYRSGTIAITGRQIMGAALPGWRWNHSGLEVTLFGGLDVQDHRYRPDDV